MNVDVRIVAATNRDLRADARRGTFREDLYWRLCVVPVMLPPLRARKGDLALLIRHFMKLHAPSAGPVLSPAAEQRLLEHGWPGNVRELRNVLHRTYLLRKGERIEADDVSFESEYSAAPGVAEQGAGYDPCQDDGDRVFLPGKSLEAIEDEAFLKTWRRLGGGPTRVAAALKLSRGAIYRRLKRLGMDEEAGEEGEEEKEG
jgi:DNA-binding NtrC family response regulator